MEVRGDNILQIIKPRKKGWAREFFANYYQQQEARFAARGEKNPFPVVIVADEYYMDRRARVAEKAFLIVDEAIELAESTKELVVRELVLTNPRKHVFVNEQKLFNNKSTIPPAKFFKNHRKK